LQSYKKTSIYAFLLPVIPVLFSSSMPVLIVLVIFIGTESIFASTGIIPVREGFYFAGVKYQRKKQAA